MELQGNVNSQSHAYSSIFTLLLISEYLSYHFSKSGSGWAGGIENVYHDPCQDWLDIINMKLTSPNYPEQYNKLDDCTWKITAPPGHLITLDFDVIDVSIARMPVFIKEKGFVFCYHIQNNFTTVI